jgi:MYXO-CTERM domain-containing protein
MSSFSGITVTADGRAEIDEASLSYAGRSTGDSADTAAVDDEDPNDTANGGVDSGEPGLNAGEWLGEPGGCGCSTPPMTRGMAFLLLPLLLLVARRRSTRPA